MDSEEFCEGPVTNMDVIHCRICPELSGHLDLFSPSYAATQYLELATDDEIHAFLQTSPLYDTTAREWTNLVPLELESDIFARIHEIVTTVVATFAVAPTDESVTREICRTNYAAFAHVEKVASYDRSSPAMVVKAAGPSFQNPPGSAGETAPTLSYTNVASCFHIQIEASMHEDDVYYAQESSVYARQIFIQQPNRHFVRNLLISEEVVHLYHFDRTGAQYTPSINIHTDPATFIRLILGLSSTDEELLGFDTSVQWVVKDGRKCSGSITVECVEGNRTTYQLCDIEPCYRRYDIFGRGMKGWRAMDQDGREVSIKDYWRLEEGAVEYEVMKGALGVPGAAQLHNYEVREKTTAHIRANGCGDWSFSNFKNRISTRIVLDSYGDPIVCFKSQTDVVAALRDAIAAHRTLVNERDILHRDVSQNNILLGKKHAKPGERGIIADFDLALKGVRPLVQVATDPQVGTSLFMSISLLASGTKDYEFTPHHDQLDDLESYYYALYELMNSWKGVGQRVETRPRVLTEWDLTDDYWSCANLKLAHYFLENTPDMSFVPAYWLPATRELVAGMYRIIRKIVLMKIPLRNLDSDSKRSALQELLNGADSFYDDILALFDVALADLEIQEPAVLESRPGISLSKDVQRDQTRTPKRAAPSELEDPPVPTKRARRAVPPTRTSPHRTRAYMRAAASHAAHPDPGSDPQVTLVLAPEGRVTRAAAKAARCRKEQAWSSKRPSRIPKQRGNVADTSSIKRPQLETSSRRIRSRTRAHR